MPNALHFIYRTMAKSHLIYMRIFWQQNIQTYLPVIQGKQLTFALYSADTIWQENVYGINEPITTNYLSGSELDIVLLPLVGFDSEGRASWYGGRFL